MPTRKDLKKLTRTRMAKTGESYTAAREQLLRRKERPQRAVVPEGKFAELAGMSDEAVKKKTGKSWKQWVRHLDAVDAAAMPHAEIARYLHREQDVPAWWAQTVTVGYERIRGLRDVRQRRGGRYEANKSKTIGVAVDKLYRAFSTARTRSRWLPDVEWKVRRSTRDKSIRLDWHDGTRVDLYFWDKGADKSQVSIQHRELAGKEDVERARGFWGERLAALAELLTR